MNKYLAYFDFLPTVESSIEVWSSRWEKWNENRRLRAAARKHGAIVANLDARIRYDIGESDCRPLQSRPRPALLNAHTLLAEELLKWSI